MPDTMHNNLAVYSHAINRGFTLLLFDTACAWLLVWNDGITLPAFVLQGKGAREALVIYFVAHFDGVSEAT